MKILYLNHLPPDTATGGGKIEKRNFDFLSETFTVTRVGVYKKNMSVVRKLWNMIFSPIPMIYTKSQVIKIKSMIKRSDADVLFIDNSLLGYFAIHAKRNGMKVITFFHNCEVKLFEGSRWSIVIKKIKKTENIALANSDLSILITKEDSRELSKHFGEIGNRVIIPTSYPDLFVNNFDDWEKTSTKIGLFVGSMYKPNIEAIKYLINNIAPKVSCELMVIGHGLDKYSFGNLPRNMRILGGVNDLSRYIVNADFMIFPIFSGSGMKVKTVESLMYGKYIIGSEEAFRGYDTSLALNSCKTCKTAQEFINEIENVLIIENSKYYEESRRLFVTKYSDEVVKKKFSDAICELVNNK